MPESLVERATHRAELRREAETESLPVSFPSPSVALPVSIFFSFFLSVSFSIVLVFLFYFVLFCSVLFLFSAVPTPYMGVSSYGDETAAIRFAGWGCSSR